ncbi:Uncharacterised protein [Serratia quinivorans]|nr:Uncharacterised protein [Serratia quinivorans]
MRDNTTFLIWRQTVYLFRQIRRSPTGNCRLQIATGQPLHRSDRCLHTLLYLTPRAIARLAKRLVIGRLINLCVDILSGDHLTRLIFRQLVCRRLAIGIGDVIHFLFDGFGRGDRPLGPRNVHRLIADLADQLRLLLAFLLFLFIKDRAQGLVGVLYVAAQVTDVLRLFVLIADDDGAVTHRRTGSYSVVAAGSWDI